MTTAVQAASPGARKRQSPAAIDTDFHNSWHDISELLPYLDTRWHPYLTSWGWQLQTAWPYTVPHEGAGTMQDAIEPSGSRSNADLEQVDRVLMTPHNIAYAVCTGFFHVAAMDGWHHLATALCSAYNDWTVEHWLDKDPRMLGSIYVASQDPAAAAREIDRMGPHPQMVQVFLPVLTGPRASLGDPMYRPIIEAAARNDLAIGMHHGTHTQTVNGYMNHFIEWHTALTHAAMCQIISLVCNGVFEFYPGLKVVMLETGFTWIPHLMSRLDQQYREVRVEVPWLKRMPSDYMRTNVRVATQPMEEMTARRFMQYVEQMETDRMLVFATDFPHWDFDAPSASLPAGIPDEVRDRVLYGNAAETYGLPELPPL